MAVVTCHFNWPGFTAPTANLRRFIRQTEWMGVPVFGMELKLNPDTTFITQGNPNWHRLEVTADNVLFQKEACINELVRLLPAEFTSIAWVDADLEFENPHVFDVANSMLGSMRCVQLFSDAVWTTRAGKENNRRKSCVITGMDKRWLGHPGFAWAARRELFTQMGGLYSMTPVGHGDTVFALSATNSSMEDQHGNSYGIGVNTAKHDQWSERMRTWLNGKVGFVDGECWHSWHGDLKNRQYAQRSEVLKDFDHELHIGLNERGILHWKSDAPVSMREYVHEYFLNRREDTEGTPL